MIPGRSRGAETSCGSVRRVPDYLRSHRGLIDRRLYLGDWAADDERRELTGVPDAIGFATKPQLAGDMLEGAHATGIRAGWVAADEVYGGRELRRRIRALDFGTNINSHPA